METINLQQTALIFTDPQNDFLHPDGAVYDVVEESLEANHTIDNMEELFKAAHQEGVPVFISPHYYYPNDYKWKHEGAMEKMMHKKKMFHREDPLSLDGFEYSGADWLDRFKPYIEDENTTVVSPHKVYGPQANDLVLQLRKRGIRTVLLGGMSANLCVESHLRHFLEEGFEVIVIRDATAAAKHPELGDGNLAAQINFSFIAHDVVTTEDVVSTLRESKTSGERRPSAP